MPRPKNIWVLRVWGQFLEKVHEVKMETVILCPVFGDAEEPENVSVRVTSWAPIRPVNKSANAADVVAYSIRIREKVALALLGDRQGVENDEPTLTGCIFYFFLHTRAVVRDARPLEHFSQPLCEHIDDGVPSITSNGVKPTGGVSIQQFAGAKGVGGDVVYSVIDIKSVSDIYEVAQATEDVCTRSDNIAMLFLHKV